MLTLTGSVLLEPTGCDKRLHGFDLAATLKTERFSILAFTRKGATGSDT
jgi:hypothetical protein